MVKKAAEKKRSAAKKDAPKKNTPGNSKLGRVIVVEDDPVLAVDIEAALLDAGASEVVICISANATMQALDKKKPDAMVLDVHLADSDDGWALAELVTMLGPRPPRIAFSTGSPEDIPPEIAQIGPIFEKPYDPAELADALAKGGKPGFFARLRGAIR